MATDSLINSLSSLSIIITGVNGNKYDVTENVTAFTIYESIDSFFLSGIMSMYDDSGLINRIPLVGQESVLITFVKDSIKRSINLNIIDIHDVTKIRTDASGIKFRLVSTKELLNSASTFSQSYSGSSTSIISSIHADHLNESIRIYDGGASTMNIVFPYIKPYQAISKVLQSAFDVNGAPLFLFETLNGPGYPVIKSIKSMMSEEAKFTIGESALFNTGLAGSTVRGMTDDRHHIDSIKQEAAYNTLSLLSRGSYASNVTHHDISLKTVNNTVFNYKNNAESVNPEMISDNFKLNEYSLSGLSNAKHHVLNHNSKAFDNSLANFTSIEPRSLLIRKSYTNRMFLSTLNIEVDPIKEIECGNCINVMIQQNIPTLDKVSADKISSGKYMISAIAHIFTNTSEGETYKMAIELVRDGIGINHQKVKK
mgnify:CR=1 FL=1|jgi:hypothetical protein